MGDREQAGHQQYQLWLALLATELHLLFRVLHPIESCQGRRRTSCSSSSLLPQPHALAPFPMGWLYQSDSPGANQYGELFQQKPNTAHCSYINMQIKEQFAARYVNLSAESTLRPHDCQCQYEEAEEYLLLGREERKREQGLFLQYKSGARLTELLLM